MQHIFQKARVTSKRYKKQLGVQQQEPLFSEPLKNLMAIRAQFATHSKGVTSYPENMAGLAKRPRAAMISATVNTLTLL